MEITKYTRCECDCCGASYNTFSLDEDFDGQFLICSLCGEEGLNTFDELVEDE